MGHSPTPPPANFHQPPWSPFDEYLWHSCDILADVLEGHVARRPIVATTARLGHGDRALATGPGLSLTWKALGSGRYTHTRVAAFGHPAFVIGSLVGSAVGNSTRRRQAARAAQPRWVVDGTGDVTLTLRRLHFAHAAELDLEWGALTSIELASADVFQTSFVNTRGARMTVRVQTPWASLAFALAAITAFPAHPRLLNRSWLPADFEQRCARMGRPCRPAAHLAPRSGGT
ncbi:hypothetical protein [Streptomyces sp. NPDC048361]|uniref:hypothetical protein n=1 Tax=Streptomyces sp. NPDC048361 TaxID=3154720 RepID=UPI00343CC8C9